MINYLEMLSLLDNNEETASTKVVRNGMNLRLKDGDSSFWNDFINLCNDSIGMGELLGVKESQIRTWAHKIREEIKNVTSLDQKNPELAKNSKVIQTGN